MGAEFDSLRQEFSLIDRCFKVFQFVDVAKTTS